MSYIHISRPFEQTFLLYGIFDLLLLKAQTGPGDASQNSFLKKEIFQPGNHLFTELCYIFTF